MRGFRVEGAVEVWLHARASRLDDHDATLAVLAGEHAFASALQDDALWNPGEQSVVTGHGLGREGLFRRVIEARWVHVDEAASALDLLEDCLADATRQLAPLGPRLAVLAHVRVTDDHDREGLLQRLREQGRAFLLAQHAPAERQPVPVAECEGRAVAERHIEVIHVEALDHLDDLALMIGAEEEQALERAAGQRLRPDAVGCYEVASEGRDVGVPPWGHELLLQRDHDVGLGIVLADAALNARQTCGAFVHVADQHALVGAGECYRRRGSLAGVR